MELLFLMCLEREERKSKNERETKKEKEKQKKRERRRNKENQNVTMSPLFLPRIVPLPPFDAASAASTSASASLSGCCCFDAVADAEEALEAQVNERENGFASVEDRVFFFPSRALLETLCFASAFSLDEARRGVSKQRKAYAPKSE